MKTVKAVIQKFPVISSVLVLILSSVLTEIHVEYLLQGAIGYQAAFYLTFGLEQSIVAIAAAVLISKLGLLKSAGLTKPTPVKSLWLVWPIIVLSAVNGFGLFDGTFNIDYSKPLTLTLFLFIVISTGFVEEIVYRGFITTVLVGKFGRSKKGIYQAVLLSSALFGIIHLLNLVMGRETIIQAVSQVIYAFFFGVFFSACYLRFKSLWPSIITHALFDFMGTVNEVAIGSDFTNTPSGNLSITSALITIAYTLPIFIYGMFLLRRVSTGENTVLK